MAIDIVENSQNALVKSLYFRNRGKNPGVKADVTVSELNDILFRLATLETGANRQPLKESLADYPTRTIGDI